MNEAAVKIARDAREVSGSDVFIAGAIGPLGSPTDDREAQSSPSRRTLLEGRGVDLFMIETFYELDELVAAIGAVRAVSSLPIVALLTFDEDSQTLGGRLRRAGRRSARQRSTSPRSARTTAPACQAALRALERMGESGKPLAALPNVGLASLAGDRVIFPHATPDYFAEFAAHARELGARIIGGCCGTTPTEIAAIRAAVDEDRSPRDATRRSRARDRRLCERARRETLLQRKFRAGEFVVSVEIDPPRGGNAHAMLELARALQESGHVDVVDVNDNPRARARMSGLIASATIERVVGLETIPHLTPRDASIAGLESMLLGAHAEGIRNVLAVTGDPPEGGDYPGAQGVYDIDSIGLSQMITRMNAGEDYNGREIDAPTSFFLGVAVNPAADDLELELERFERKLEAGARFAMTQVLFDLSYLESFLDRLGGTCPIPLLVGVFYVRSYQLALRLHNEVPGIVVPAHVQDRLRDAGANAGETGLEIARELVDASRERRRASTSSRHSASRTRRSICSRSRYPVQSVGSTERVPTSDSAVRTSAAGSP